MNRNFIFLLLIPTLSALWSCKSKQAIAAMEEVNEEWFEDRVSLMNIPIRINAEELERSINSQLEGILYEDKDMNDGDDMMVKAEKREDISLTIDSQLVKYRVPLGLWIKYDAGLMDVQAKGDIALNFKTSFNIKEDWTMETLTELEGYEWLKKPTVNLIGINLPVGFIADLVLRNSKATITKSIDEQVKQNIDLKKLIGEAWVQMHDPILVSEEFNTWLTIRPESIGMTPLIVDEGEIVSTVVVESRPVVELGEKPETQVVTPLPSFKYKQEANDDFTIHLRSKISFEEAERIARNQTVGETFSQGKRSVKIEDLRISGKGTRLLVSTTLSGSYSGNIELSGRPVYNHKRNAIDIDDLDFTLDTKNVLYKTAAWLLKGTLRKEIQKNMDFLLDYNMQDMKKQLQQQLEHYPITESIFLKGDLDDLNIQNAFISTDGILVDVALKGRLNVQVNGLN